MEADGLRLPAYRVYISIVRSMQSYTFLDAEGGLNDFKDLVQ